MKRAKTYLILLVLLIAAWAAELAATPAKKSTMATQPAMASTGNASTLTGTPSVDATHPIQIKTQQPAIAAPVKPLSAASVGTMGYTIGWSSINSGGATDLSSPSYRLGSSVGQPATGEASSAHYTMGVGFWYGAGGVGGCNCPMQGDLNGDAVIDVFDIIEEIGIAFSGAPDPQDAGCPKTRGDVDNNGLTDVFDVIYLIATAFSGGHAPVNPCGP